MPDRKNEEWQDWLEGIRAIAPLLPAALPFGMMAGLAAAKVDFDALLGIGQSAIIFAGASQIAMSQLIGEKALPAMAVLTVLLINLRFAMYSASLSLHLRGLSGTKKSLVAYLLTDQAYALALARFTLNPDWSLDRKFRFYLGTAITLWVVWMASTALGYYLGAGLPPSWGLEFGVPITFIALMVPGLRDSATVAAACVGGVMAVIAAPLPNNLGLFLAALCGIAAGYVWESVMLTPQEGDDT
ncbi:AzlC family ABC transporter permease [Parvibaculum sp. MBR-TMA-1.3b-4.2]|jgi:predicted branched-subunit amino acid permease